MVNTMDNTYRGINYWTAMVLGWILVGVGLLGFVWDPVLFLFDVGPLHNVIHLASGLVLLAGAYANHGAYARTANLTLGLVYAVVTIIGFVAPGMLASIMDFGYDGGTPVWAIADNWLHLLLTGVLLSVPFAERHTETRRIHSTVR